MAFASQKLVPDVSSRNFEKELIDTPAGAGERWCPFHLPTLWGGEPTLKDEEWRQGEGLENFNNKMFNFVNKGRENRKAANLSGVIFPGTISFCQYTKESSLPEVSFTKAEVEGNTSFTKAHFGGIASFKDAIFSGDASFDEANFADNVSFLGVSFGGIASFKDAAFSGKAYFGDIASPGAKFRDNASFDEANFADNVSFLGVSFDGIASFKDAAFSGDADFSIVVDEGAQGTAHTFHRAMFSG